MGDDWKLVAGRVAFVLAVIFGLFAAGFCVGRSLERSAAAKAGAAHYTVNPETGDAEFHWGPKP